jgi:LysR family transcriptional regulator, cyn operon transcriptional activator
MMNPKHIFPRPLQYLIAVAEHGSFTRAAEALYVSQPTLSQQIKQLEDSLDLPLLDRSGKSVRLTDAGETYVFHARRAWSELEAGTRAVQDVQNLSRGSLRIGWTPITDFLTCSLLDQFNRSYPGISLTTLEMPADGIETAVHDDLIDFGIVFSKPISVDQARPYDIKSCVLFEEKLCLTVGNSHPRAGQKERISAKELGRENMIMLNTDFVLRRKIDSYCLDNKISPNIAMQTDSLSVIIEMVQAGTLATILPESIVYSQCGLHSLVTAPRLPDQVITVICRNKGYKSPACIAFSELAMEWSKNRHQQIPQRKQRPCPLREPGDSQSKFFSHFPKKAMNN